MMTRIPESSFCIRTFRSEIQYRIGNAMQSKTVIRLHPVKMNSEIMRDLEKRGLIFLMGPGKHTHKEVAPEKDVVERVYVAEKEFGSHMLLAITKNQTYIPELRRHSGNEEFLLIGDNGQRPLYLLVALMSFDEMIGKYNSVGLTADDFVLLDCTFNDPACSFFTMYAGTPHVEFTGAGPGMPPSFYVTESSNMVTERAKMDLIEFAVDKDATL